MSLFQLMTALTSYFEMAGLLSFSAILIYLLVRFIPQSKLRYQDALHFTQVLVVASFILPLASLSLPQESLMRPQAQVFSSGLNKTAGNEAVMQLASPRAPSPENESMGLIIQKKTILIVICLLVFGSILQIYLFTRRWMNLRSLLSNSQIVRKIGKITLLVSEEIHSPFSCRSGFSKVVVIPTEFLARRRDLLIALQHEFQHHRNGDVAFILWLELLKALFFWNPFAYLLGSQINLIQEFACDEFLIGHQKTSLRAYGDCLVRTAESAVHSQVILVGTAHMAGNLGSSILKRRIEMLFKAQTTYQRKVASIGTLGLTLVFALTAMASIAYASQSMIQKRQITLDEARVYAEKTAKQTEIPIDINDLVLRRLNYFIGNTHGRAWAKRGLVRMESYKKMIDAKTAQTGLPEELIAIPLFESGFQNHVVSPSAHAKGIWQFIAQTAQHYDLTVNDKLDERLNPEKETEAAMKYFSALNGNFHDWRLAIKAYNEGEHQVQKLIDQLGTKDPWVIERAESSEDYLSGAIAMMIVMKNPELLK